MKFPALPHLLSITHLRILLSGALLAAASNAFAQAQAPTKPDPAPSSDSPSAADRVEQRIERIRHEDALTRVDELRVGQQTRSITVQPKVDAPAYEVTPSQSGEDPNATRNSSSGKSRWRLLDF